MAITDNRVAPIAADAPHVLLVRDDAPELSHSMTGLLSLFHVLATLLIASGPERARGRLERLDGVFRDLGVIAD